LPYFLPQCRDVVNMILELVGYLLYNYLDIERLKVKAKPKRKALERIPTHKDNLQKCASLKT
jgi:hypothetical protein